MKVTQMFPVHATNLVTYSGNTAYGVDNISGYLSPNQKILKSLLGYIKSHLRDT